MSKNVLIYADGNRVIARDNNGREGVARCHPDDKFDFETGATIALKRYFDKSIKVGDMVKVVDVGKSYTTYAMWVEQHVKDKCSAIRYCYGSAPNPNVIYKVLYSKRTTWKDTVLHTKRRCLF